MGGAPGSGSGRARRDAAARAMQGWHSQRMGNGDTKDPNSKVWLGVAQKNIWCVLISVKLMGEVSTGVFLSYVLQRSGVFWNWHILLICFLGFWVAYSCITMYYHFELREQPLICWLTYCMWIRNWFSKKEGKQETFIHFWSILTFYERLCPCRTKGLVENMWKKRKSLQI